MGFNYNVGDETMTLYDVDVVELGEFVHDYLKDCEDSNDDLFNKDDVICALEDYNEGRLQ